MELHASSLIHYLLCPWIRLTALVLYPVSAALASSYPQAQQQDKVEATLSCCFPTPAS